MSQPADQDNRSRPRVVLLATDRSQSIIGEIVDDQSQTIAYSAYGEQSAQQKIETRLGFNGQLREANIGWYLLGNGYRAYNPRLMRFHSPDSWSPFGGGGLNAYMYCVGDPVNRVDPTGHIWQTLTAKARRLASEFHLPNYRAVPAPKDIVSISAGADAARALQQNIPIQKTHDLTGFFSAAEYAAGKKSPPSWTNDAAERLSGVQATPHPQQPPGFLGSSFIASRQKQSPGKTWKVSSTAHGSSQSPSASTSSQYVQKPGSSFDKPESSRGVELKPLFKPRSNNVSANSASSNAYGHHAAYQKYYDAQPPGRPPSYTQVMQEKAIEEIRNGGKK